MPYEDGPRLTLTAGSSELPPYRLCKLSSGKLVLNTATATDRPMGSTEELVPAGELACIKAMTSQGTMEFTAAGAIAFGADFYAAADGKVQALPVGAGTYRRIGTALEAASGDGAVFKGIADDFNSSKTVSA